MNCCVHQNWSIIGLCLDSVQSSAQQVIQHVLRERTLTAVSETVKLRLLCGVCFARPSSDYQCDLCTVVLCLL